VLIESANSQALPQQLRQAIAEMAWVRAILLHDDASAAKLEPLLPAKLIQEAAPRSGPLMTLLRNPGLRPYLDPGVQRSYSYDFVESYRDNWWCTTWPDRDDGPPQSVLPGSTASFSFLTAEQQAQSGAELKRLHAMHGAETYLGQITIDYVNAHPSDSDNPESLYLVLRMIRYGCASDYSEDSPDGKQETANIDTIRKSAARLLRQHYATSPWTKNAAPYVGGQ
jgi:hypothetical protein